jgi:hypothetical protein
MPLFYMPNEALEVVCPWSIVLFTNRVRLAIRSKIARRARAPHELVHVSPNRRLSRRFFLCIEL